MTTASLILPAPMGTAANDNGDVPMRVLNPDLQRRLAAVNRVTRELRVFGIKLVSQRLTGAGVTRPILVISGQHEQLRAQTTGVFRRGSFNACHLMGVELQWGA